MGANTKGIDLLARIAEPTHGYITNIGLATSKDSAAQKKCTKARKLFDHLASHEGTAFVQQGDDKVVRANQEVSPVSRSPPRMDMDLAPMAAASPHWEAHPSP